MPPPPVSCVVGRPPYLLIDWSALACLRCQIGPFKVVGRLPLPSHKQQQIFLKPTFPVALVRAACRECKVGKRSRQYCREVGAKTRRPRRLNSPSLPFILFVILERRILAQSHLGWFCGGWASRRGSTLDPLGMLHNRARIEASVVWKLLQVHS